MRIVNHQIANVRLIQASNMPSSYTIGYVSPNDYSYEGKHEHYTKLIDAQTVDPDSADRVFNVPEGCSVAFQLPTSMTWKVTIDAVDAKTARTVPIDGYGTSNFIVLPSLRAGQYVFLFVKAVS